MIRRAGQANAASAAQLWLRSRRAAVPSIPAPAHSDDDVRGWFATHVVVAMEPWLAERDGRALGVLVLDGEWVSQLYVDPDATGRGIGSALLGHAKAQRPGGLWLWTFETNHGARRFYERHGFAAIDRTDGDNEEGAPDVLYAWTPD